MSNNLSFKNLPPAVQTSLKNIFNKEFTKCVKEGPLSCEGPFNYITIKPKMELWTFYNDGFSFMLLDKQHNIQLQRRFNHE